MNKRIDNAFTLAEMVIATSIIAVLAALTIPTFITNANYRNNSYVDAFRKAYTNTSYAVDQMKSDNAGTLENYFISVDAAGCDDMRDRFGQFLKYSHTCDAGSTAGNCWHNPNAYNFLDGSADSDDLNAWSGAMLSDGTLIVFNVSSTGCTTDNGTGAIICGEINVDINGFKEPNTLGRDIFKINVTRDGIKPVGDDTTYNTTCVDTTDTGEGCAARILQDGRMMY